MEIRLVVLKIYSWKSRRRMSTLPTRDVPVGPILRFSPTVDQTRFHGPPTHLPPIVDWDETFQRVPSNFGLE